MNEIQTKVNELLSNQEFVDKLKDMETIDDIAEAFTAEGVEVTADELEKAAADAESGNELDENALEAVSGGVLPFIAGPAIFLGLTALGIYIGGKAGNKKRKCR